LTNPCDVILSECYSSCSSEMSSVVPPVVLKAAKKHTATLFFLHGLGDTGFGWAGALNTIKPDYLKVICPTAPTLPVTINGGAAMPAWYDIMSLDERDSEREDTEGVNSSVEFLHGMIEGESQLSGFSSDRIMIGGFSQGGAVALRAALTFPGNLAGCVALSCYLPGPTTLEQLELSGPLDTSIFQAHGDMDQVVSYKRGQITAEVLQHLVKDHKLVTYRNMGHEGTMEELNDIKDFIASKFS